jgi:hypothetical protein
MKKRFVFPAVALALCCGALVSVVAQNAPKPDAASAPAAAAAPAPEAAASAPAAAEPPPDVVCFESRKGGATDVTQRELKPGLKNVKCSPKTGAALWYGDPLDGTIPMGKMPQMENLPEGKAFVKPRSDKLALLAACGTGCHNGVIPPTFPKNNRPVPIPTMETLMPEIKDFQHGRGRIWCLDCHHPTKRNMLVDHFGDPISFEQPSCCVASATATSCATGATASTASASAALSTQAQSAGSPAPSATTRTTCKTASATRASSSCSRNRHRNCRAACWTRSTKRPTRSRIDGRFP